MASSSANAGVGGATIGVPQGYPDTTNLDKMRDVSSQSQNIGEFVEWLREQGWDICEFVPRLEEHQPTGLTIERLLARYFDIDLDACERERTEVLNWVRADDVEKPPVVAA